MFKVLIGLLLMAGLTFVTIWSVSASIVAIYTLILDLMDI